MNARTIRILFVTLACAWTVPLVGLGLATPPAAHAQASEVASSQQLYDQGKFSDAIAQLKDAIASGRLVGGDLVQAKELLARCHVKAGDAAEARRVFLELQRQDPLYRPDALRVPPDEMEVYDAARRQFEAERERARQRIPASIALFMGLGSGSNSDFGEYVQSGGGGDDSYDVKPFFGGSVRFPLRPRISLELELQRFRATNEDTVTGPQHRDFEITAIPVVATLNYLWMDRPKWRTSLFAGGGPLLQATSSVTFRFSPTVLVKSSGTKSGAYLHGGIEGEYLFHPRLSAHARLLGRYAKATEVFEEGAFSPYSPIQLTGRDVEFSGIAVSAGIRAYVGY